MKREAADCAALCFPAEGVHIPFVFRLRPLEPFQQLLPGFQVLVAELHGSLASGDRRFLFRFLLPVQNR